MTRQEPSRRRAGPFVGRARELHVAQTSLAALVAGHGGAILVCGEPGIGKTGLAEEVGSRAARLGVPVVWGACIDDEGVPPLWSWWQVLAACQHLAGRDGPQYEPADLLAAFPGVTGRAGPVTAAPPDGSDRFRFFESVASVVSAAAASAGLVLVLDDLHWADPLTAMMLAHLGRNLATARVLVVVTYRDQDMTSNAPAREAVAALVRERGTAQLKLAGLAEAEVAEQLEATFSRRFDHQVVSRLARRTAGNPFFVAELGRLVNDAAQAGTVSPELWEKGLPEGVRAVIGTRLGQLPPTCQDVLRTAAVIAPDIEISTVAAVSGLPPERVLAELDAAVAAGLVRFDPGAPAGEFSHALVRDAIKAGVPASQQAGMHLRAAGHLEADHGGDLHVTRIAHHMLSAYPAADAARAVVWAERAAARSMGVLAYEEAARLYERTLHVTDSGGVHGTDRCRLLLGLAEAQYKSGDVTAAITAAGQAADEAQHCGDMVALARAAVALEGVADEDWGRRVIQLAPVALRELGDDHTELRARLLAATAAAHSSSLKASTEHAGPLSLKALALAEAVATPAALVSALRARQLACAGPDGVDDRLTAAERMLSLAADRADPWAGLWGRLWRIDANCQLGAIDLAEADVAELADIANQLRQPVADWHLARTSCALAMARGRFAEAADHLGDVVRIAGQGLDIRAWQNRAIAGTKLASLTGDPRHEHWFATLEQEADTQAVAAGRGALLVAYYARRGELDQARSWYEKLPPWQDWQPPPFLALPVLHLRAQAAVQMSDAHSAAIAYERLRPWARYFVVGGTGLNAIDGSAEHMLGCLAACLGKPENAVRHLRSAVAANQRAGLPPFELQSRHELAKVLAKRGRAGDRAEALLLADDAASGAARLGMQTLRADAQQLAASLRGKAEDAGPDGLTRREHEIADLVSRGLTNRQIAGLLQIAERTAENHVQHILTKLGFNRRSQIAAWAIRQSLRSP